MRGLYLFLEASVIGFIVIAGAGFAQPEGLARHFKRFPEHAPGIDFFASSRDDIIPFEPPLREAHRRLSALLGNDLARGAIIVCSTPEQRDSVSEARVLKMGYRWALIQLTPAAGNRQALEQMKARMGGQVPAAVLERMRNQPPEMKKIAESRLAAATAQRAAHAIIAATLAPEKPFRSSRLDDMGRSPLADWLDIALAAYAAGGATANLRFLQERVEEAFPLEDMLTMSRPFVPPSAGSGPEGSGMIIRMGPGGGPGSASVVSAAPGAGPGVVHGSPNPGGEPGFRPNLPREVEDRMLFDAQAALFFSYIMEKAGEKKAQELVEWNRKGNSVVDFLCRPEILGSDLDRVENEWHSWLKQQKGGGQIIRLTDNPPGPPPPP